MINNGVGVQTPLQLADITGSIDLSEGVVFEPNRALLVGVYRDELSAYRARREWLATLNEGFLLEPVEDLALRIEPTPTKDWFILSCEFTSATARYAFWRITRGQAPEEQYRIESAHVASQWEKSAACSDLKRAAEPAGKREVASVLAALDTEIANETKSILEKIVVTTKEFFHRKPPQR